MARGVIDEVELGLVASDALGSLVVGSGGFLGGAIGAEPHPHTFVRIPNFSRPFSPRPLPDSSVYIFASPGHGPPFLPLLLRPIHFLGVLPRPCKSPAPIKIIYIKIYILSLKPKGNKDYRVTKVSPLVTGFGCGATLFSE